MKNLVRPNLGSKAKPKADSKKAELTLEIKSETFALEGSEFIELKNLLKVANLCDTGAEAKSAIGEGLVLVNGIIETRKACKIRSGQVVSYNDKKITITA